MPRTKKRSGGRNGGRPPLPPELRKVAVFARVLPVVAEKLRSTKAEKTIAQVLTDYALATKSEN